MSDDNVALLIVSVLFLVIMFVPAISMRIAGRLK